MEHITDQGSSGSTVMREPHDIFGLPHPAECWSWTMGPTFFDTNQHTRNSLCSLKRPSTALVAAGDFGFLTLIQVFDGPERYGAIRQCLKYPNAERGGEFGFAEIFQNSAHTRRSH
jgi:hypothetical protein